jgi:membrane protease YdiL (CAAX protease family)
VPEDVWGLRGPRAKAWLPLAGAAIAVVVLGAVVALDVALGKLAWDPWGRPKWAHRWPEALARGAILGPIEEVFFRGWLLDRCLRRWKPLTACAVAAAAFALPHLFKASVAPKGMQPGVASALDALSAWLAGAADLAVNAPRMVGLFLLGIALAAARLRAGSLWLAIGIHGVGIVVVDAVSALSTRTPERDALGSKWLYDGAPAWALLLLLAVLLWPRGRGAGAGAGPSPAAGAPPLAPT